MTEVKAAYDRAVAFVRANPKTSLSIAAVAVVVIAIIF